MSKFMVIADVIGCVFLFVFGWVITTATYTFTGGIAIHAWNFLAVDLYKIVAESSRIDVINFLKYALPVAAVLGIITMIVIIKTSTKTEEKSK